MCYDKCQVTCHFKFFMTVADSLVEKLPCVSGKYGRSYVNSFYKGKHVMTDAFEIKPVSEEEVKTGLSTLSTNKATGLDLIPSRFLRDRECQCYI